MAKSKVQSINTDPAVAVHTGLFGPGRAKFLKARYGKLVYANGTKATALKVKCTRAGEKADLAWTVGNGFGFSEDGLTLVPKEGQTVMNDSSNLYHLCASLMAQGAPKEVYSQIGLNASLLDGVTVDLVAKPLDRISDKGDKKGASDKPRSVLVVDEIISAPWKKGGKKKASDDDDEDEDADTDSEDGDDEEEEEEEKPKKKKKAKASDDDEDDADEAEDEEEEDADEDEDEKPAKGKAKKGTKAKAADDDEEEEEEEEEADEDDDDEDLVEPATEALIEALSDGPIKLAKVKESVLAHLGKHKQKKEIAALASTEKFLKKQTGWTFNGKVVDLDK